MIFLFLFWVCVWGGVIFLLIAEGNALFIALLQVYIYMIYISIYIYILYIDINILRYYPF